jgi:hypothetical protein
MYVDLLRNGCRPIPIGPKSKISQRFNGTEFTGFFGWRKFTATETDTETWSSWPDAGWGPLTKYFPAVDPDVTDADLADPVQGSSRPKHRH